MRRRQRSRGQALVEFALALPIFLMLMMAVFDLGRAIYMYNGVAEAARELARVTSVYPGTPGALGSTTQTAAVLATQKALIPSLGNPTFTCVDIDGSSLDRNVRGRDAGQGRDRRALCAGDPGPEPRRHPGLGILEHLLDPAMNTTAGAPSMSANVPTSSRERERGQIIVIFALALVAIIAMVGLVLDGGSSFAMRRDEQSAADLAALAAANDYMLNSDTAAAIARARTVAAANGYTHGTDGVVVNVTITTSNGAEAQVDISAPHRNNFASIVGMPTWPVATTAKAQAGYPDTANGAGPIIFSIDAFGPNGQPQGGLRGQEPPVRLRRDQRRHPDRPGRPRLDQLRDRQPRLERRQGHHPRRQRHQQDDRLRRVHRPAQQR